MSRWHTNCENPDIFADGALPRCRSCGKSPSISEIGAPKHPSPSPWNVPPDEPRGQLYLHWPRSVPYSHIPCDDGRLSHDAPRRLAGDSLDTERSADSNGLSDCPSTARDESQTTTLYPRRLRSNEFRLIWLSARANAEQPVHMTLEIYDRDNCPEYEATSYCWGGEDGDNTFSKPVYIGPHWDILFQTRNCWAMLSYLQRFKAQRTVWVDAICINQADTRERGEQVQSMRKIYHRCMRVVVYLGNNFETTEDVNSYPTRLDLSDQDSPRVREFLHRRYFSRVWAVQELILAPLAVLCVDGVELRVTSSSVRGLFVNWEDTPAPWVRHAAQGYGSGYDIYEILQRTWNTNATDPRDKVFGILGLLKAWSADLRSCPIPDYSLTLSHVMIGIFANLVMRTGRTELLCYGMGPDSPSPYPSWMPDWRLRNVLDEQPNYRFKAADLIEFAEGMMGRDENCHSIIVDMDPRARDARNRRSPFDSFKGASVDPMSAGLRVTLHRVLHSDTNLIRCPNFKGWYVYEYRTASCRLLMFTHQTGLDEKHLAGGATCFIMSPYGLGGIKRLLILQRTEQVDQYKMLACIPFVTVLLVTHGAPPDFRNEWDAKQRFYPRVARVRLIDTIMSVHNEVRRAVCYAAEPLQQGKVCSLKVFAQMLPECAGSLAIFNAINDLSCSGYYSNPTYQHLSFLTIIQGLINELRGREPGFVDSYMSCFENEDSGYRPLLEGGFVQFQFKAHDWPKFDSFYDPSFWGERCYDPPYQESLGAGPWAAHEPPRLQDTMPKCGPKHSAQWQLLDETDGTSIWKDIVDPDGHSRPKAGKGGQIQIRAKIADLQLFVSKTFITEKILRLTKVRTLLKTDMDEIEILKTPPEILFEGREDEPCLDFLDVAIEEFKIDVHARTVTII